MKNLYRVLTLMITVAIFSYAGIQVWQSHYAAPIFAAIGAFVYESIIKTFKK